MDQTIPEFQLPTKQKSRTAGGGQAAAEEIIKKQISLALGQKKWIGGLAWKSSGASPQTSSLFVVLGVSPDILKKNGRQGQE